MMHEDEAFVDDEKPNIEGVEACLVEVVTALYNTLLQTRHEHAPETSHCTSSSSRVCGPMGAVKVDGGFAGM